MLKGLKINSFRLDKLWHRRALIFLSKITKGNFENETLQVILTFGVQRLVDVTGVEDAEFIVQYVSLASLDREIF